MSGPGLSIILLIMAVFACLPLISAPAEIGAERSAVRSVVDIRQLATAVLIQQQALEAWHKANPGIYGVVPSASLSIPAPWSAAPGVISVLGPDGSSVVGITYYDSTVFRYRATAIATALTEATGYSGEVGITSADGMQSARGAVVRLPYGIPAGFAGVAQVFD